MTTLIFQHAVRAAAALGIALAGSIGVAPAWAETGAEQPAPAAVSSAPAAPGSPESAPGTSVQADGGSGLEAALARDLGMTVAEFNAAGEQARRAADAVATLRGLPGYRGTSLKNGKIAVEGDGAELQARVDELNLVGPGDFVLVAPAPAPAAHGTVAPAPAARGTGAPAPAAPGTVATAPAAPAAPAVAAEAESPGPAPSPVPSDAELVASSTGQLFEAYVREVGPAGLQAVAYTDGQFVIRTGGTNAAETVLPAAPAAAPQPAPGKISPAEFVARYTNVQLQKGAPIKAEEDFYGGQGYITGQTFCSAGFGAFDPLGQPVLLTAGHCAGDGPARKSADIEPPSSSTAGGATTPLVRPLAPLGTFGFSQFGGPGNSWMTGSEQNPGNVGTDIAVIERLAAGISVQPAATKWDNVANPGPTSVKIIGIVAPVQGQPVCRTGRTTSWSCGIVNEVGIYVVGGHTPHPSDLRAFHGFLSKDAQSSGGDSGGPWISGNYAVGTHSAGEAAGAPENFAIATTLEDSMARIPGGVQLQLFLNKPEIVAAANGTFTAGTPITGRVPAAPASAVAANSKVRVTVPGQLPFEVPVDAAGSWSFRAPADSGRFQFSAETVNGFSRSGAAALAATVSKLAAPVITLPADGGVLAALSHIEGTGTPGLTVRLSGDVAASGKVAADGTWSIPLPGPVYGTLSVTAVQTAPGEEDSPSVTHAFRVRPPGPSQSTIVEGAQLSHDGVPSTISGRGVSGAVVTVLIDGNVAGSATVVDGGWSLPFPAGLAAGAHVLSISQAVDGVVSAAATTSFSITPVPAAAKGAAVGGPAGQRAVGEPAAARGRPVGASGQLADTGAGTLLAAAGLGGGALLAGGTLLVIRRWRAGR